ncbi:hypothetical protein AB0C52_19920 [Streptomyces sp. NPDC048717]|uniref:hypothetical protein n=1 Tax=Streptomyces sp. NPDC048717 TaxID=3154928 RepID=UPI0034246A00
MRPGLTVEGDGHPDDLQLWMVEFQAVFAENPAWAGLLGSDGGGDTGFDFAPLASPRAEALADTRPSTLTGKVHRIGGRPLGTAA